MLYLRLYLFSAIIVVVVTEVQLAPDLSDNPDDDNDGTTTPSSDEQSNNETSTSSPPSGSRIKYFLYTRRNKLIPDTLEMENYDSILKSRYRKDQPGNFIILGWRNTVLHSCVRLLVSGFLNSRDTENGNVIVVDWYHVARKSYFFATRELPSVGKEFGQFILWLKEVADLNLNNVHLVGFDLGAHLAGVAGREVNGSVSRITALDPTGPLWDNNPEALGTSCAQYVEAIFTDRIAHATLGPIGHANFYPNGGKKMPGCITPGCSHRMSCKYMAATLKYNHMVCQKCNTLREAERQECNGITFMMGNGNFPKKGYGIYGVKTEKTYPYFPLLPSDGEK